MEIAAFEALIAEYVEAENDLEEVKRTVVKPQQEKVDELEARILQTLIDHDMTSYKSKHGTVIKSLRYSVKTPKSIEEKTAFFEWLNKTKGREVYWNYVTINSQSLNAFIKQKWRRQKRRGFRL